MDPSDDSTQRSLNEQKRRFLEEQFGARFPDIPSKLSPEAEGEWLDYITEFERQFAANGQITLREFVGNPDVRPLTAIPPDELPAATETLLELLTRNNVEVQFDREVSDAEAYRFITEELFNEMMDNIRIDQMMHTFMYDDYHPDEVTHIRNDAEGFLNDVFARRRKCVWMALSQENPIACMGQQMSLDQFMQALESFYRGISSFTSHHVQILSVEPGAPHSQVTAAVTWTGISSDRTKPVGASGIATLRFAVSPYGGWDIVHVSVPGWEG